MDNKLKDLIEKYQPLYISVLIIGKEMHITGAEGSDYLELGTFLLNKRPKFETFNPQNDELTVTIEL